MNIANTGSDVPELLANPTCRVRSVSPRDDETMRRLAGDKRGIEPRLPGLERFGQVRPAASPNKSS